MEPDITRRNRLRIVALTVLAAVNYWIAICAAAVVVVVGMVVWVVGESGALPDDLDQLKWFGIGVGVLVAGAIVIGTLVALVRFPFQRRRLERRVLEETGARVASPDEHPRTRNLLEGLAIAAGVPVPRFAIIDDPAPNSFGVGTRPKKTIIAVTTGLMSALTRDELEAILAYEVSRIRSYDVALSSWTVALTGSALTALDADDGLTSIIGWLPRHFASWLQVWALRGQTAARDRAALHFTRHPEALINALRQLDANQMQIGRVSRSTAPLLIEFPTRVLGSSSSRSSLKLANEVLLSSRIETLRREVLNLPTASV